MKDFYLSVAQLISFICMAGGLFTGILTLYLNSDASYELMLAGIIAGGVTMLITVLRGGEL